MELTLPPGVGPAVFKVALADFARVVGPAWVLATDADRDAYLDLYALDEARHVASAAVAPATVEEIRAIVRLANQHRIPLWPISRGKNLCYGGAAPMLRGAVILDLSRMKAISFDAENGTVLVEPGVGFYDLLRLYRTAFAAILAFGAGQQLGISCGQRSRARGWIYQLWRS